MSENTFSNLTPKCEAFLRGFWDEEELSEGLKDPIKFTKEVINPYLRDLRNKGKDVPIVCFSGSKTEPILKLSTE